MLDLSQDKSVSFLAVFNSDVFAATVGVVRALLRMTAIVAKACTYKDACVSMLLLTPMQQKRNPSASAVAGVSVSGYTHKD